MDAGQIALMIPILGLSIPIVAIVTNHYRQVAEMRLRHGTGTGADAKEVADLKRRVSEMEQRVVTLQDLVIGGEHEVRRKLEAAQNMASSPIAASVLDAAQNMAPATPAASVPIAPPPQTIHRQ